MGTEYNKDPKQETPEKNGAPLGSNNNRPKFNMQTNLYWVYAFIGLFILGYMYFGEKATVKEITWSDFQYQYLNKNLISRVVYSVGENGVLQVNSYIKKDSLTSAIGETAAKANVDGPHLVFLCGSVETLNKALENASNEFKITRPNTELKSSDSIGKYVWGILPLILLIVFWLIIMRRMNGQGGGGGGVFSVGKSKAKLYDKESQVNVDFTHVAGMAEAKQEIEEIVSFLKSPDKYTELGGKIPKGALLVGPPGTGKTLLAKAVAGEAHVPFFSMSGSDFVEMFVGVGASRVRDLFKQAKEKAPCIIFIDEIDAIGRARGKNANMNSNDERENTLNQLLTEMDGFGSNSGVIILAATNRADILDKALLRAGRFDRQIQVDLPDVYERKEIFKVHLKPLKLDPNLNTDFLAKQTPGFSGADIANVCNEAALIAARHDKKQVERQDFLDAVDRIVGGLEKRNKIMTVEEKKGVAFHEAGHAAVSWLLEYAHPLVKVTIVPRGKALGAAWYLPDERQMTNVDQILDEMCSTLGGRAAEEVNFGMISTGALSDLEKVTRQAYAMVCYYGMSSKIGNLSYYDSTGQSEYSFSKPYSEKTAEIIDQEVSAIVENQYLRAKKILTENKEKHNELALLLLDKEVIFTEDMERIFGARPWVSRNDQLVQEGTDRPLITSEKETPNEELKH